MNSVLWIDWCSMTGTPMDQRDDPTLERFAHQARPSQKVLSALREPREQQGRGSARPSCLHEDPDTLTHLLWQVSTWARHRGTSRITRSRLRRLAFAAVLLAPVDQGGLA